MFAIVEAAGWPIWFLILASVISVGLIVERLMFLRSKRIAPPALLDEVVQELRQRGVSEGMLARLTDNSPLGRIFSAGLKNISSTPEVMKESIEEAGRAVADAVHRRLETAVGRDHDDFDLGMRVFDVMQEIRSGAIGQFQIQRDEINAVVIENG